MQLGRFVSEVYRILVANAGTTAGEIFIIYRTNHPNTIRSRNEVAKRISELKNLGLVDSDGSTVCNLTGFRANTWFARALPSSISLSTEKAEKSEQFVSKDEDECRGCGCGCAKDDWTEAAESFDDEEEIDDDLEEFEAPVSFKGHSREEKAKKISEQAGEQCVAMDPEDEQTLHDCKIALKTLVSNPLFRSLAPADFKKKAKKLEQALRYF